MNPITTVRIQNTGPTQSGVPFTFGHAFCQGHLAATDGLGALVDGKALPLQMDVKATHPDGSVRHAIISGILPTLDAKKTASLQLVKAALSDRPAQMSAWPLSQVSVVIDDEKFTASSTGAADLIWLDGWAAREGHFYRPLKDKDGKEHPHLHVRFCLRKYDGGGARIDVTVENDWAYEPNPQNFTYDVDISLYGKSVYSQTKLTHLHHSRWHHVFWAGWEPVINIQHDNAYLISTGAVPNYELLDGMEDTLWSFQQRWNASPQGPMKIGLITPYMPTTGGRDDIGILPGYAVTWILTQDEQMRDIVTASGDMAGSFSCHYRDKGTGRPVSLRDYPYMTIMGRETDTGNPKTGKREAFPWFDGNLFPTPYTHDVSHHPSMAYLPYLITGDYYDLEELQFWAMWMAFSTNPGYRDNVRGLMQSEQLRGQAWALRTLGQAAYISPDKDSLKGALVDIVNNNLDWYTNTYAKKPDANKLSIITNGYAISDLNNTGYKPWQDDFFMSVMGHLIELGFDKARTVAEWKSGFQIGRLLDPEFCRTDAAMYVMRVRDSDQAPIYASFGEAWRKSVDPNIVNLKCDSVEQLAYRNAHRGSDEGTPFIQGEIIGYSRGNMGYPSNLQPAVAVAADYGPPAGKEAYRVFMNRSVKPDYRSSPQFNILPRTVKTENTVPTPAPTPNPTPAPATLPSTVTIGAKPKDDVTGTWSKIGNENETVKVAVGTFLRYGAPGKAYVYGQATATSVALNNATWGDPAVQVVKQGEAFKADPPKAAGKIKTGANKLLAKQKGLQVTVIDPSTLAAVKVFSSVAASSTGVLTLSDTSLTVGAVYALKVVDVDGKILDIIYPATATK